MSGPTSPRSQFPRRLGSFHLQEIIGQGSTGMVFMGADPQQGPVAIKLAEQLSPNALRRFTHEIDACRRLDHPNIVRIRGSGVYEGRPWYAMDYHGTVTLRDLLLGNRDGIDNEIPALVAAIHRGRLRSGSRIERLLPANVAINLIMEIGRAVAHAHGRGLVHRDLKPENVLIREDGRPVVCDFGLVKDLAAPTANTGTGRFLGTIGYQAPEQRLGTRRVDERVDVFALGVMLDELLTGRTPRPEAVVGSPPRRGSDEHRRNALARDLRLIIHRATCADPNRRYHSVQALVSDLERHQLGERIRARPDPWWLRLHRWGLRHRLLAMTTTACLALAATAAIASWVVHRIGEATWDRTLNEIAFNRPEDLDDFTSRGAHWRAVEGGTRPGVVGDAGSLLLHRRQHASDFRLTVSVHPPVASEAVGVGLVAAVGDGDAGDGYRWLVGHHRSQLSLLVRDGRLLWVGRARLEPGRQQVLELEMADRRLTGRIDGTDLFTVADPAPLSDGSWGLLVQSGRADAMPVFAALRLQARTLPDYADPDELPRRLLAIVGRCDSQQLQELWPDLVRIGQDLALRDPAFASLLVERSQQLPEPGDGPLLPRIEDPLTALQLHWWQEPGPSDRAAALAEAARLWKAFPGRREALLRWAWNEALRDPATPLLGTLLELAATARVPPDAAVLLADLLLRRQPWNLPGRAVALPLLDQAEGVGELAERAALHRAWQDATAMVAAPRSLESRFAAAQRLFDPRRVLLGSGPVEDLVLGQNPAARFDLRLADQAPATAADRRLLTAGLTFLDMPLAAWSVPGLESSAVHRALCALFDGDGDPEALARADGATLPWPRLAIAHLLLRPDSPDARRLLVAQLPDTGLDLWAAGLAWRWAHGSAIRAEECPAYGREVRDLVVALEDPQQLPRTTVPTWHPSRPLLELLLAVHAKRHGLLGEAERRCEDLLRHDAGWLESVAAERLLLSLP